MTKKTPTIASSPTNHLSIKANSANTNTNGPEFHPGLFDSLNPKLAKDHYMTYVMLPSESSFHNDNIRYYLSRSNKDEFLYPNLRTSQKRFILDEFPNFETLIKECITTIMGTPASRERFLRGSEKDFIAGIGCFLGYLASGYSDEHIEEIQDIDEQTQIYFYDYAEQISLSQIELSYVYRFFSSISKATGNLNPTSKYLKASPGTPAYPSPVIYKLDYYARQSIRESITFYTKFSEALKEAGELNNLFTLENLLKTRYSESNAKKTKFLISLDGLIKRKYGISAKLWSNRRRGSFVYPSKRAREQHVELIALSRKGLDISPSTLPIKLWWFTELFPDWPQNTEKNYKYDGFFTEIYSNFAKNIDLSLDDLNAYFKPSAEIIYPLLLLLQIRTGKNTQVLTDIKVEKTTDKKYTLGLRLDGGGRKIFSVKSRTNSEDYIFLHTDKDVDQYIEIFLEWFSSVVYKHSKYDNFFQGVYVRGKEQLPVFFTASRRAIASKKFLGKYEIFDHETNKRLESINHMRLRPSFVGSSYIRGLKEYETQHLLRHKQAPTQHLHYSNHIEAKEHKLHKLAWAQRKIVDIFKGIIVKIGEKELKLGKGVLSDCADSKSPTHNQKPKLRSNENCSDWMFCLLCEKSRVIKELHGPVTIAMKLLLKEMEEVMPTREWEKEYGDIYDSIESVLMRYTDEEKEKYSKKAPRHRTLCENAIYMKRKRKDNMEFENAHQAI